MSKKPRQERGGISEGSELDKKVEINMDEWLAALGRGDHKTPENGWFSGAELAVRLNVSARTMSRKLRQFNQEGTVEVSQAPRENIDGVIRVVPVYRLKSTKCEGGEK